MRRPAEVMGLDLFDGVTAWNSEVRLSPLECIRSWAGGLLLQIGAGGSRPIDRSVEAAWLSSPPAFLGLGPHTFADVAQDDHRLPSLDDRVSVRMEITRRVPGLLCPYVLQS